MLLAGLPGLLGPAGQWDPVGLLGLADLPALSDLGAPYVRQDPGDPWGRERPDDIRLNRNRRDYSRRARTDSRAEAQAADRPVDSRDAGACSTVFLQVQSNTIPFHLV